MNGVATITAHDGGRADAALVQRFRQSQTTRERTAVLADVVHQHRHAVLSSCAERLWPDADAAVAAAAGVFAAAGLAMADSAKLPRPDRLRDWLLGIAAQARPVPGQPARIDDVDWEAVRARIAVGTPEMRDSPARVASLRQWLERIVATLPEPRQRMYDLFVTRGLDSRNAAVELAATVAEVRRLRRENRQAILRAFEVTALAAAEAAVDPPGIRAPGCAELRQMLADARSDDGDPHEDGRRHTAVLPAALRLTLSRHLSQCRACQDRRDDCMGGGRPSCCRSWPTPNCTSRSWRTCSRCQDSGSPAPGQVPIDASPRPARPPRSSSAGPPPRQGRGWLRHCCCSRSCGPGFCAERELPRTRRRRTGTRPSAAAPMPRR